MIDSHLHLNDENVYPRIDEVLAEAKKVGVERFICVGYDKKTNMLALQIALSHPEVYAVIGFHPGDAKNVEEADLEWLESHLSDPKVVAIGEVGLDYYWDKTYVEKQKTIFRQQIQMANRHQLPLVIHMRDAIEDTYEMLKQYKNPTLQGVMHCYSGSQQSMRQFLDMNMKISLAGPVTFQNARRPKEVAEAIRLEDLLIETDSPFLAPMPYRGKPNEPKYLPLIAKEIATIKGISFEEVAGATEKNARALFRLPE